MFVRHCEDNNQKLLERLKREARGANGDEKGYTGEGIDKSPVLATPSPSASVVAGVLAPDFTPPPIGIQTVLR